MPSPLRESGDQVVVAILGATGSVGTSTLEVARHLGERVRVEGMSAHRNLRELVELAREFRPAWIAATDDEAAERFRWPALPGTEVLRGESELVLRLADDASLTTVVAAMVGIAGLRSTLAALRAGKIVALANKETLVAAGPLVMEAARESGAVILPVDSEHNAIFQCLAACQGPKEVSRVILTASGGPFRDLPREAMNGVTPEQALAHPNWEMGQKISVDSATMMNKALEIVEARWLFDLSPDQIEVVVHPQSIVHSMVEFQDGCVIAQLSPPDMRLPIQHALLYPYRVPGPAERMDFARPFRLEFHPPDIGRFPALGLGYQVARRGGTAGSVLNAANEVAVHAFLENRIGFNDIVRVVGEVLAQHPFLAEPTIEEVIASDHRAREETGNWLA